MSPAEYRIAPTDRWPYLWTRPVRRGRIDVHFDVYRTPIGRQMSVAGMSVLGVWLVEQRLGRKFHRGTQFLDLLGLDAETAAAAVRWLLDFAANPAHFSNELYVNEGGHNG